LGLPDFVHVTSFGARNRLSEKDFLSVLGRKCVETPTGLNSLKRPDLCLLRKC